MTTQENSLNWFEIPVKDMARAKKFYETIFGIKMEEANMMGMDMAFFPSEPGNGKATGGLAKSKQHKPSTSGCKIYLNANPNMTKVLSKVEKAGGAQQNKMKTCNKEAGEQSLKGEERKKFMSTCLSS